MQQVTVLGSTGSIGVSTLDVLARHPERYQVFALTAHRQWQKLAQQCLDCRPRYAVLADNTEAELLKAYLAEQSLETQVLVGIEGLQAVAADSSVDTVMAAIVGAAGLLPTMAAVQAGKKVLLANKEVLVMAGGLFTRAVAESGATLLPIDSEHNAIFQSLPTDYRDTQQARVSKVLLTASGGPFRTASPGEPASVTPEQACAHPNWSMGRKISVDSASMMNKGLELIEACWLFDLRPEQVEVVVHPQSVIHSMVQYIDGSVLAQLGNPDMRTPIAHALAWPERVSSGVASLDLIATARLDFETPDLQRFPCLRLAYEAIERGGTAPAILNAANEVAVEAFLNGIIGFNAIAEVIELVVGRVVATEPLELADVQAADAEARRLAAVVIASE